MGQCLVEKAAKWHHALNRSSIKSQYIPPKGHQCNHLLWNDTFQIKSNVLHLWYQHSGHQYNHMADWTHYGGVIMSTISSQITSLAIVYSTVYSDADQRKHQSSASLAFVWGIHRGPVNSPHKWPVTRKMSPFDDVIMIQVHAREWQ